MSVQIKICGLSTPETIDAAVAAGASHIGLVHVEQSPRHVSLETAAALRRRVPPEVKVVLLLTNQQPEPTLHAIQAVKPDVVQFHGRETPEWLAVLKQHLTLEIWKAIGVSEPASLERARKYEGAADFLLFDAAAKKAAGALQGGNGLAFDWSMLSAYKGSLPWGLAGGLHPDNVAEAIRQTGAGLVDASTGLETAPGVKDVDKIAAFCKAAREA